MEMWLKCLTFCLLLALSCQRSVIIVDERKSDETREESEENFSNLTILVRNSDLSNCSCDSRYNVYYEAKGCIPAHYDLCRCPMKYICDNLNEIEDDKVCHYQGKIYASGDEILTNNPCEKCHCSEEFMIVCALEECPQTSSHSENCHDVYELDKCCPVNSTCFEGNEEEHAKSGMACVYNNRTYPLGAKMYSKDDACEVCLCTEEWIRSNGTSSHCYQTHCILEKYKSLLLKGCAPVYQDDACCPTDFYCAPDEDFFRDTQTIEPNVDLKCSFFGKNYHVGDSVSISQDEHDCLSCTCQVPPDVTCIQQVCKPNPNEETCYPYYTSGGGCCPHYECLMNDGEHESVDGRVQPLSKREMEDEGPIVPGGNLETSCIDVQCDENAVCMLYLVSCGNRTCLPIPTCIQQNANCTTPVCGDGCVVTELDSSNCPVCVCGENVGKHKGPLKCMMPYCEGQNCLIKLGANGCPSCFCAGPCPELDCKEGCNVVTELEGRCPKCVCEDETEGCPTPVCEHEGCRIENSSSGCPTCVCGNVNTERELEESNVGNQVPAQQQQQQQVVQSSVGMEESYPPEMVSATAYDYDDAIVFIASNSQQSSNMKEMPGNSEEYDDSLENKQMINIIPQASNSHRSVELDSESESRESVGLFVNKPTYGNGWLRLDP